MKRGDNMKCKDLTVDQKKVTRTAISHPNNARYEVYTGCEQNGTLLNYCDGNCAVCDKCMVREL